MIVVKVELWSAITGETSELARMVITNDGTGGAERRNYDVATCRGRSVGALTQAMLNKVFTRRGKVKDHPSEAVHVWNLVAKALTVMGYGK
jgi:hypothetical protein